VTDSLEQLLAPDGLDNLTTRPIAELRELRVACTRVEADVSLARRVAQGRLDIVGHEVQRRNGDEQGEAELNGLLFDLPDILADSPTTGPPSGRPVNVNEPGPVALDLVARLDSAASPSQLASVSDLDDSALGELFDGIRSFELELSSVRRQLHERIDSIQSEIGRRYRDGETSIESFIS